MNADSFKNSLPVKFCVIFVFLFISGCTASLPKPDEIIAPTPKLDNTGLYMCPYTQDGVLAEWVDMAINAKMGAASGKLVGTYAGAKATGTIAGGDLGRLVGDTIGRSMALKTCGGLDFIKSTSDISFNNLNDLAIYMYAKFSSHEHYKGALDATMAIYPQLEKRYFNAIKMARKK